MAAIDELFEAIIARITDLHVFGDVVPALNGGQLALPSAEVWLGEVKLFEETPEPTYDISYICQITVGYKENKTAHIELHLLLESLRATFTGWKPGFIGVLSAIVPTITIASHDDHGKTSYIMQILLRVSVDTFTAL